jgi:glycosyltransferase involved in cell wall biosynthesis
MHTPLISVVVPCYNAEPYVVASLRSVLAQQASGEPDLEVIVVDDGSRDGSVAAIRAAQLPVTIVEQANAGVAAARNAGIARARGRYVAFIDADDIWLPGKLQAQRSLLAQNPGARMCYTAWQTWPSLDPEPPAELLATLGRQASDTQRWAGASGWIYGELLQDCVVWTSTVLAERTLLEEAGGFDPSLRIGEDYDLWLRLSRVTPIPRVAAPLALYRLHPASTTRSTPTRNFRCEVIERALQRWGYVGPDGRAVPRAPVERGLAASWAAFAGSHLQAGNRAVARRSALKAIGLSAREPVAWVVLAKSLLPRGAAAAVSAKG